MSTKGNYRKAAKLYQQAVDLEPDEPTAYYNLGLTFDRSEQFDRAAHNYLMAMERYEPDSEVGHPPLQQQSKP